MPGVDVRNKEEVVGRLRDILDAVNTGRDDLALGRIFSLAVDSGLGDLEPETLWEPEKRLAVFNAVLDTERIPGDIVELGIYKGGGTFRIARLLKMIGSRRRIVGVDSFAGLPEPVSQDFVQSRDKIHYIRGMFADTSRQHLEQVFRLFGLEGQTRLIEGFFEQVIPSAFRPDETFSMIIVDCDQYSGTKYCLEYFYPRVLPGGSILIDDYNGTFAPGVTRAVDEFLADKPETIVQGGRTMWVIRRV